MPGYLILGCGYTASRVAQRLVDAGEKVICTNRQPANIAGAENIALAIEDPASLSQLPGYLSTSLAVLHSIPATGPTAMLLETIAPFAPRRLVYLSTTGVYGAAEFVDEQTPAAPNTDRDTQRLATEDLIAAGPWSSLILRPAAIYGPGRGVHISAHSGVFKAPPGGNRLISRIHVDDLATHALAALKSDLTGRYPVADEQPCPSQEVAEYAFRILKQPFASAEREPTQRDQHKPGRRVDGSAVRHALNLQLRYPSYREGVPACLEAEGVFFKFT